MPALIELPARKKPRQTYTVNFRSFDVTDPADLQLLKEQKLREIGSVERGVPVMLDCLGALWFSVGVIEIMHAMRQVLRLNGSRFVLINVDGAPEPWLVESQGFEVCGGSAELLYSTRKAPEQ